VGESSIGNLEGSKNAHAAGQRDVAALGGWNCSLVQSGTDVTTRARTLGRRLYAGVAPVSHQWQIVTTATINQEQVAQQAFRKACWIVGTNVLEPTTLSDPDLIATYKGQGSPERGFRFLKDPLFLASSVTVSKPERIMALSFIMVLCLLVYRLAEVRLRTRLAQTQQTIPDQVHKPTARPTMRWVFQCFEGIELLHVQTAATSLTLVLRLQPIHRLILQLLGPHYEKFYLLSG
jgi:transposase